MSIELLEQITRLMKENDLSTLEVRDGERRIALTRGPQQVMVAAGAVAPAAPVAPAPGTERAAPSAAAPGAAGPREDDAALVPIKSPMVGTFYASPSPDAKPFVGVGTVVDEESDVCVIEAMKVFNNIKAEVRGTIARVMVSNGQTVEFGQPLFLVKPS
jgi:acetyl-CoA carboxylase biotin carboxyl carrier protein